MKLFHLLFIALLISLNASAQQGLKVDYFEGRNFERYIGSKTEAKLDLKWDKLGPLPSMGPSEFSARIKGYISVPVSGTYTFSVRVDDGLRLSIGGVKLFNTWQDNNHVSLRKKLYLEKDRYYTLEAEYFNGILEGELVLIWELPTDAPEALKRNWPSRVSAEWFSQNIPIESIKPKTEVIELPATKSEIQLANKSPKQTTILPAPQPQPLIPKKKKAPPVPPIKPKTIAPKPTPIVRQEFPKPQTAAAKPIVKSKSPQPKLQAPKVEPLPDSLIVLSKRTAAQIGFVKSKAELLPASFPGLDSLAQKLNRYPLIQVEINGHTDYIGDSTNNLKLSFKRAQAVAAYLIEKGIAETRLKVQGFGGKYPLSYLDTEAEHNRNRRVEIKLFRKE